MAAHTSRRRARRRTATVPPSAAERTEVRVGDAEREAAAHRLNRHFALGHLSMAVLEQRLEATFAAVTAADLEVLVADLPAPADARRVPRTARSVRSGVVIGVVAHTLAFVVAVAAMWLIWLLTWTGHPWPIYPTLGWATGLTGHVLAATGARVDPSWFGCPTRRPTPSSPSR